MNRRFKWLLILAALALFAFAAWLRFAPHEVNGNHRRMGGAVPVEVVVVQPVRFVDRIEALGTAKANESVTLTARVAEVVGKVHFQDGQQVKKGTILVEFDRREEEARLREAEAALKEAEQQLARTRDLVRRGNASRATLDERERDVAQARARVAAARAQLADRIVRAPFDGVLGLRQVSPGALVSPGTTITTIDDITPIKLDFSVPERFISALRPGQRIRARAAAWPDRVFEGKIETIASRVDPVTRAVTVRAVLPNDVGLIRPGMLLSVEVLGASRENPAVPEEALLLIGREHYVFVIGDGDIAEQRRVVIGTRLPGLVEIRKGLKAGERVVVAGILRLRPETKVRIVRMRKLPSGATGQ